MSINVAGGRMLDGTHALPPKEQRILAPSVLHVVDTDMGATQCACTLRITDPVNLVLYYVPMTGPMVTALRKELSAFDPHAAQDNTSGDDAA